MAVQFLICEINARGASYLKIGNAVLRLLPSHPPTVDYQYMTTDVAACFASKIYRRPLKVVGVPPLFWLANPYLNRI